MVIFIEKYSIKLYNNDFKYISDYSNAKGSRKKKMIVDNEGKIAFFKYEGTGYFVSEACSEKLCYEIAQILGYRCAKIELAKDKEGKLGVLNYLFTNEGEEQDDAISYINPYNYERSKFYTVSNIKQMLDRLDKSLFKSFLKIMVFDALVGEQDKHEENWGIVINGSKYSLSLLYDNGCSLLREFKNLEYARQFYNGKKDFNAYIFKSKTLIYKENSEKKFKHFELISYLYDKYYDIMYDEINNLNKLTNEIIVNIVNKIPDELMIEEHKKYIIRYLIIRRDILLKFNEEV